MKGRLLLWKVVAEQKQGGTRYMEKETVGGTRQRTRKEMRVEKDGGRVERGDVQSRGG